MSRKSIATCEGEFEVTRQHLQDAHQRVMSVAEVQLQLHASEGIDRIDVSTYLAKLCAALASSMITEQHPIQVRVSADDGTVDSAKAVSLGLIVTELVINAIKYAFPSHKANAQIFVTYKVDKSHWKLTISDNGIGKKAGHAPRATGGLGTTIVKALADQLGAKVETVSSGTGLKVSIASPVSAHLSRAA